MLSGTGRKVCPGIDSGARVVVSLLVLRAFKPPRRRVPVLAGIKGSVGFAPGVYEDDVQRDVLLALEKKSDQLAIQNLYRSYMHMRTDGGL